MSELAYRTAKKNLAETSQSNAMQSKAASESLVVHQLQQAVANPLTASAETLKELSHRYGKRAVQRLLASHQTQAAP